MNAQWREIPGLYLESEHVGMNFKDIIVDGEIIYAHIDNYIYISYNKGNSWMRTTSYDLGFPECIASNDSNLYVGTYSDGVMYSENFGTSFIELNNNLPEFSEVRSLQFTDSTLIASIESDSPTFIRDVYISLDWGENWFLSNGLAYEWVYCFASEGANVYAATHSGVYYSNDHGRNWVNIGLENKRLNTITVKDNNIFAAEGHSASNLFLSTDNGTNWTTLDGNGLTTNRFNSIDFVGDFIFIAAGWDGVFRSNNNGSSWTNTSNGITASRVKAIAAYKDKLLAGTNDGLAISNNSGSSWGQRINTYNLKVIDFGLSGNNIIATTNQGVNVTKDYGNTWDRKGFALQIVECIDSLVYLGSSTGLYHSTDYGVSFNWTDVKGIPDDPMITDLYAIDTNVYGSFYGYGIYYSENAGVNWSAKDTLFLNTNIISLTLMDSTMFAITETDGIYRSGNLGENWDSDYAGLKNQKLTCISHYGSFLYAGTEDSGFYKSDDYGDFWSKNEIESSNTSINCLMSYGNNIFAGVEEKGLFLSPNKGEDWHPYNQGLFDFNINSIECNDSILYISSKSGAIWARPIDEFHLSLSVKEIHASKRAICFGDTIQLTAQVIGGQPPYKYTWSDNQNGSSISVSVLETTNFKVNIVDFNSDTTSLAIKIWVFPKPDKPTIVISGDTLISNSETGNIWFFEGAQIDYATSNKFFPRLEGNYSTKVIKNGCLSDESDQVYYNHPDFDYTRFNIYPNPARNILMIEPFIEIEKSQIHIVNMSGQLLKEQVIGDGRSEVDISNLRAGIYCIMFDSNGYTESKVFVIE